MVNGVGEDGDAATGKGVEVSLWEERAARNEALFREVNEQVQALNGEDTPARRSVGIVCECSDERCIERLTVPLAAYEHVRASSRRFIVAPEHVSEIVEHVVEHAAGYWVVEKDGRAARIAEVTDPRD